LMLDLNAQIDQANTDVSTKSQAHAAEMTTKATKEDELATTNDTKTADENYLADLKSTCGTKATDYASRQTLRAEEIKAIEEAISIISSDDVRGNAVKHLPSMVQSANRTQRSALAALRASLANEGDNKRKAHDYLLEQAHRLNSRVLTTLASALKDDDPFAKVKQMIQDLIMRLQDEANSEANHKSWCDSELAANEQTRKDKSAKVDRLNAEIDVLDASIMKLATEITELSKQVTELEAAMATADLLRTNESSSNTETIKDAQDAQQAVAQAIRVLQTFYNTAAGATALVQQKQQPVAPTIFDSPYTGKQSESTGILGLLAVVESDFARLEADTKAAEASADKVHSDFMSQSDVDKTAMNKDIDAKTLTKQKDENTRVAAKADLDDTQKELDAALSYYETLKPSCVDASVSYDERVSRREEEIQSLQEALAILDGQTV